MTRRESELYTAQDIEEILGKKYFYRQNLYRLADEGVVNSYYIGKTLYLSKEEVVREILKRLARRVRTRIPQAKNLRLRFDEKIAKEIVIYSRHGNFEISADTQSETEEELLRKVQLNRKEVTKMADIPVDDSGHEPPEHPEPHGPHHGPHDGHGPHHPPPPPPHHHEIIEALRRIDEALRRIEEKLDKLLKKE